MLPKELLSNKLWDFPDDPVAKTLLPVQGTQVPSPVRELDPACRKQEFACSSCTILHAATSIQCSHINLKKKKSMYIGGWVSTPVILIHWITAGW